MENKYNLFGIYQAVVVNTSDPLNNKRIKMNVPQILGKSATNWADPAGEISTPVTKGQKVFAMFIGGDITRPVYMVKGN